MSKGSKPTKKKVKSSPKPLTNLPEPAPPTSPPQDSALEPESIPGAETVGSWEDLPGGDYLDPDEHGTNWFRANNGDNWYQNLDGTWTKWID